MPTPASAAIASIETPSTPLSRNSFAAAASTFARLRAASARSLGRVAGGADGSLDEADRGPLNSMSLTQADYSPLKAGEASHDRTDQP
ncbi:hypothetical protein GCM10010140_04100 [Streptosporangium pseudovulgare]|uniref:FXSXX-COOH protein n=1 Tax=Streptosporangium pseudovulgare TaxID=35765 RepID=A0ABQ2QGX5_9ACTN|nr:hypothetical protein GCM10010140_04100 [Streptosporangium pseudovulgare]